MRNIVMKAFFEEISVQSVDSQPRYKTESLGLNFVTPHKDTIVEIEQGFGIQSSNVSDYVFLETDLFFENKIIGFLSFQKKYFGKNIKIKTSEGNFKGVITEDSTNLEKDN
jgi:hypothetical protein